MKLFNRKPKFLTPVQVSIVRMAYQMKCCADCGWLKAKVSWWCMNPEAVKVRGTAIPGVQHCPYWKPDKEWIRKQIQLV